MPKLLAAALVPALLIAGAAAAQKAPPPKEEPQAEIPFVSHGGIYNFESDRGGEGVFLQDRFRHWYYARFFSRCSDLPFAMRIGYKTFAGSDTLDRGSTIIADHQQCRIASLTKSSGPPPKPPRHARR